jgi:hypothetical protein
MDTERFIAVASLVALLMMGGEARVKAAEGYPAFGLEVRNGDTVALGVGGIVVFGSPPGQPPRPLIASLRGEVAHGGVGAGIGLVIATTTDKPDPDLRDLFYSLFGLLEMRVERMYGSTSWTHTTYAGPRVTFYPGIMPKLSLSWMADIHNAADNHIQVGIGGGF